MVPARQPLVAVALVVLFQAHDALRVLGVDVALMERLGGQRCGGCYHKCCGGVTL